VNHWILVRTVKGWRVKERYSHAVNGSKKSHDLMRKVMI
jgi:hypothetical protein